MSAAGLQRGTGNRVFASQSTPAIKEHQIGNASETAQLPAESESIGTQCEKQGLNPNFTKSISANAPQPRSFAYPFDTARRNDA